MATILTRDQALTIALFSTFGTASLLSREGLEIKVPLAPLLGASTLVRSIVAESHLHPGLHGPIVLSFAVAADILVSVGEILGVGESNVKRENIEGVKQVLDSLEVEANLSESEGSNEYNEEYEYDTAAIEDDIQLKIEFELKSGENADLSDADANESKDYSPKQCYDNTKNFECSDQSNWHTNKDITAENLSDFKKHMKNHTEVKPYRCTVCGFSCSKSRYLKMHNRTHISVKSYTCQICNSSFPLPSKLRRHRRIHTGEKPYACKSCNMSFPQPCDLRRHCRTHTGEKPYNCQICDKSFSRLDALKLHEMNHTGEKPLKCKICNYSCKRSSNLKQHMIKHTGEAAFKCQGCDFSATTRYEVKKHEKKSHDA